MTWANIRERKEDDENKQAKKKKTLDTFIF
jgi:hypothetical protein